MNCFHHTHQPAVTVSIPVSLPVLRLKFGKYHPFETPCTEVIQSKMANQIWSKATLEKHISKFKSYLTDNNMLSDVVNESESEYGSIELNYIERTNIDSEDSVLNLDQNKL